MILRTLFLTGMLLIKTQQNMIVIPCHLFDACFVVSVVYTKTLTQTNLEQDGSL